MLRKRIRRALRIEYRSKVAYVQQNWADATLCNAIELKNRPMHYLADPFLFRKDKKLYCFVEDLDYTTERGCIDVYELSSDGGVRLGTAVQEQFHLSFPFLFEYNDALYMCPELSENRDIRIYQCVEFPLKWKLHKVLMENVSAVDSMLLEKGGKWWMLTNIDPLGIGDHCSELSIFSASSPLESNWEPHPMNPVMIDAGRARNAGYVMQAGRLYRCSQGQGFDFYGKRLLINEINKITEADYQDSCACVIDATFGRSAAGTHHFHSDGQSTVFDFVTSSRINS